MLTEVEDTAAAAAMELWPVRHAPAWFWRPSIVRGLLALTTVVLVGTMGTCYGMWLQSGCLAFLPFVSDLGISGGMGVVFECGNLLEGLLQAAWVVQLARAQRWLLVTVRAEGPWLNFHDLLLFAGFVVAGGTTCIGLFPWDRTGMVVRLHFVFAACVFYGGCFWGIANFLVSWRIRRDAPPLYREPLPLVHAAQPCLALGSLLIFSAAPLFLAAGFDKEPEFFHENYFDKVMVLARQDFKSYCTGSGWHGIPDVNIIALVEWTVLGFMFLSTLASLADVELYMSCTSGCYPFPAEDGGASHAQSMTKEEREGPSLPLTVLQARTLVGGAALLLAATLCYCHAVWLRGHCLMFAPFPTAFGMYAEIRPIFKCGTLAFGIFYSVWVLHIGHIQRWTIKEYRFPKLLLPGLLAATVHGICFAVVLMSMPFFFLDEHFYQHAYMEAALLYFGTAWAGWSALFSYHADDRFGDRTMWKRFPVSAAKFIAACLVAINANGVAAFGMSANLTVAAKGLALNVSATVGLSTNFTAGWFEKVEGIVAAQVNSSCHGRGVVPAGAGASLAAVPEWGFFASFLLLMLLNHLEAEWCFGPRADSEDSGPCPGRADPMCPRQRCAESRRASAKAALAAFALLVAAGTACSALAGQGPPELTDPTVH